jgi:oligopeptide/dipeptide ABC transporter ATP-binding protein
MTARLEVRNLVVRYGSGKNAVTAVDGVDLVVPPAGTLGLVGESGCGKSTIARAVVGLVPLAGGSISLDGKDHTAARSRGAASFRRRVQMVFQDPYSSLNPRMPVGEALAEAVSMRGPEFRHRSRRRQEVLWLLDLVGLPADTLDRYPHQFSGGQRQRIAIARALAVRPTVIIADEVTSSLDVSVQATILNLLKDLQRELQLSYLFISHDLSVVRLMSDQVTVMYLGRVVENADSDQLFARARHPYTQALIGSLPDLGRERTSAPLFGDLPDPRRPPAGCRFHTRCPIGPVYRPERTICVDKDPQLLARTQEHLAACHFAGQTTRRGSPMKATS